jgi:hypothetical protein
MTARRLVRGAWRPALWLAVASVVFLSGRALAYALAPLPTLEAARLGRVTGGARPLELAVGGLALAALLAGAVLAVATAAVRQRHLLASGSSFRPPAPSVRAVAIGSLGLWLATALAFALIESRIHAEHGLHMSPFHCLFGPVHRDVLPIFAALSLLAAALVAAAEYLLVWLRRTLGALRRNRQFAYPPTAPLAAPVLAVFAPADTRRGLGSRAPPRLLRPV